MLTPIYFYKTDSLTNLKANSLVALKTTGDTAFSLFITDKNGLPYPLKDEGGTGGITAIQNTDGNLTITGGSNKVINVSTTLLNLINSALQPGDITQYTDEQAQDAVGTILIDSSTIDFTYNEDTPNISADIKPNSITTVELADDYQLNLGFTPENVANKQNSLAIDGTGTKYPTVDIINNVISEINTSIDNAKDKNYVHYQISASNIWVINHNLKKYPSISIVDSGNNAVVGNYIYNSIDQLTITFTASFSGKAYIN